MKKIIVADDSTIINNVVERAFKGEYEVVTANDGEEAINIIKNNVDDSIAGMFLDLNMPKVDGFAVLEYFKQNNLFRRIPICIITGDISQDRINRAFNYDIVDVLTKPFSFDSARKAMEKMISINSLK